MTHSLMMEPPTTTLPALGAHCTRDKASPQDWDIDPPEPGMRSLDHLTICLQQAMDQCGGCPLLAACARRTLELADSTMWCDVVIAGIPMMIKQAPGFKRLPTLLERALFSVSKGDDLDIVHHQLLHTLRGYVELAGAVLSPGARARAS